MSSKFSKDQIVARLGAERSASKVIFDALCGSGITAKLASQGGADLVTTFNLAHYRMQGLSSMAGYLPIGDANATTLELGERFILNVVKECPVVAGVLGVDPTRDMCRFVDRLKDAGFHGVMNCPTVALIDGNYRTTLEETGMGFSLEVDVLKYASQIGMFTKAFCTTPEEALSMAEAGVNNIIIHFGNSSGGTTGSKTVMDIDESAQLAATIFDVLSPKYANLFYTCHGGSIEDAAGVESLLVREPRFDGYVGGSSVERLPVENSVLSAVESFKSLRLKR
ncbi:MAG: phosphoenolpyruvate hydrolase family protein [Nitrospinota bacterium]|nr:phosphoenolpyruvate hydrolase family protein [Nitrospinota bacterium]